MWFRSVFRKREERLFLAIQKLHDAQLVFRDLRGPNVMLSAVGVFLIDFDWAGRVNEVRYPLNLSWAKGAEEFEIRYVLMYHDLFMLNQLFPKHAILSQIVRIDSVWGHRGATQSRTKLVSVVSHAI